VLAPLDSTCDGSDAHTCADGTDCIRGICRASCGLTAVCPEAVSKSGQHLARVCVLGEVGDPGYCSMPCAGDSECPRGMSCGEWDDEHGETFSDCVPSSSSR
jgi:hypothetical protein